MIVRKFKQHQEHSKYVIIGCNRMFGANEETFKSCRDCSLLRTDNECLDNIMVGERLYLSENNMKTTKKEKNTFKRRMKKEKHLSQ